MFCHQCGNQIAAGSRFCSSCGAACTPAPSTAYTPQPTLTRSRQQRVVAGVCAGLALHYGWDITITRLILALCVLCAGTGVLAYVIAWIVIPEAPYELPMSSSVSSSS